MGFLRRLRARAASALALLLLCAAIVPRFSRVAAQEQPAHGVIVVIVSAQSKLLDLPKALVKRVFLGEPTEAGGSRLLPFNYATEDPLRRRFDELLLGFDQSAAGRYWVDRRIRGQGLPPRVAPNALIVRAAVARLQGAISYLYASQLDATVRALRIDGVPHSAPDYPLKF
jgi:hypothetical protein